ncbi:hypothetical protein FGE12_05905 [Aggregicoccus sp. 17bor-14]|uniref:sensor histidine kinase n=1 Tax=Myxococcaceae TaxID=31 RepID=UPI00129C1DF4|nr:MULTISPECIES: MASE1 domain-containing protein [Myxococcaceae]MBF5041918.1 MASE1 domain-containing protein [Simulacricoccus sp. 17bor-14]MRI87699.1 hypothetical protein [Aggregicoccus sp. 17bor-14]
MQVERARAEGGGRLWRAPALRPLLAFLGYLALAEVGYRLVLQPEGIGLWWVPQGFALAVLVRSGRSGWPLLTLALMLAEAGVVTAHGMPPPVALAWSLAAALEALGGAWLLQRKLGTPVRLGSVGDWLWFSVLGGLAAPLFGAPLAAAASVLWLGAPSYGLSFLSWALSDMLGVLALAPVLLCLGPERPLRLPRARKLEALLLLAGLLLTTECVFGTRVPGAYLMPLPYLVFPFALWAALRFGMLGAASATLLVVGFAVVHTVEGEGPFVLLELGTRQRVWLLQAFLLVLGLCTLTLAASLAERRAAEQRLALHARVGELLGASLDREATLGKLTRLLVPAWAEACAVLLTQEDAEAPAAVAHAEAQDEAQLWTRLREEAARPLTRQLAPGERELRVPLASRGRALGWLLLARSERARPFDANDVHSAEEIARRTAHALEAMRLYEERGEAVALRDDFLSVAAHELRTPLTSLHLQLRRFDALLHEHGAEPVLQRKLEVVSRQAARLNQLVETLLDVARISRGHLELRVEELDLAALAAEVAERFGEDLARAGCELRLRLRPMRVRGDRLRLEQVVSNLLANAVKFAPGEPVELAGEPDGAFACLRVHDGGPGVPEAQREHIFDRFARAVSSRWYGGLGLGLYVSSEIVSAHGGRLRLVDAPGGGACFLTELPLLAQAPRWAQDAQHASGS